MDRYITVSLGARGVRCTARLLDQQAPRTTQAVWQALPLGGQVFHGKYARNDIYCLVSPFAETEPGRESSTVTPIPGDLCYFSFAADELVAPSHGYEGTYGSADRIIDIALFYGRNNLLLNGDSGWCPGNVFASVKEGLAEMQEACRDLWMGGVRSETLTYAGA